MQSKKSLGVSTGSKKGHYGKIKKVVENDANVADNNVIECTSSEASAAEITEDQVQEEFQVNEEKLKQFRLAAKGKGKGGGKAPKSSDVSAEQVVKKPIKQMASKSNGKLSREEMEKLDMSTSKDSNEEAKNRMSQYLGDKPVKAADFEYSDEPDVEDVNIDVSKSSNAGPQSVFIFCFFF